jgi:hypothetical protein
MISRGLSGWWGLRPFRSIQAIWLHAANLGAQLQAGFGIVA